MEHSYSKLLVSAILFVSCFHVGFSDQPTEQTSSLSIECFGAFLPCQSYFQKSSSSSPPPSSCCDPLKEMVETDKKCLCSVFNDADLLKSLNVTQEEALKLPKACGAKADLSVCGPMTSSKASTTSESTSSRGDSASSTTEASSGHGLSPFARNSAILAPVAAWMSIFI